MDNNKPNPTPDKALPEFPFTWSARTDACGQIVEIAWTVKGTDQTKWLSNIRAILIEIQHRARPAPTPDIRQAAAARQRLTASPEPPRAHDYPELADEWCELHEEPMSRHEKGKDVWYSHKMPDGSWCRGTSARKAKHR